MAKVFSLVTPSAKLGFARVESRRKRDPECYGQMNMFNDSSPSSARILNLPPKLGPFEEALFFDDRNDERAGKFYATAISSGDCVADAYCNLGIIESRQSRTDEAFDCFTKSLAQDPRHLESHFNLGNLYFDIGDLRLAREHYEIAAKVDPGFASIYFNLGLVLATIGDLQEAAVVLEKYQNLVPPGEGSMADDLLHNLQQHPSVTR